MSTKDYSNKQEHMIADYLGWNVVSGSGARDFNPGDIFSPFWLGECKTHTKVSDKIKIYNSHWIKIQEEAKSVFKVPALFVDNGTQKSNNTWVVFDINRCTREDCTYIPYCNDDTINLSLNFRQLRAEFNEYKELTDGFIVLECKLNGHIIGLTTLSEFNDMYGRRGCYK